MSSLGVAPKSVTLTRLGVTTWAGTTPQLSPSPLPAGASVWLPGTSFAGTDSVPPPPPQACKPRAAGSNAPQRIFVATVLDRRARFQRINVPAFYLRKPTQTLTLSAMRPV